MLGSMKIGSSQRHFQRDRESFQIHKLNSWDSSPIYRNSAVRVFVLLFSYSIFGDHTKIENENNSMNTNMQKFDHRIIR